MNRSEREWTQISFLVLLVVLAGLLFSRFRSQPLPEPVPTADLPAITLPATALPTVASPTATYAPITSAPSPTTTALPTVASPTLTPTATRTPLPTAETSMPPPVATPVREFCFIRTGVIYTIQPGDTLWHISECAYGDPHYWLAIFVANPQLSDPDLIHAGNPLFIPSWNWR